MLSKQVKDFADYFNIDVKSEYNNSFTLKLKSFLPFAITLSISLYITYNLRPYVYNMQWQEYYLLVGSLPSFMSVLVCYYFVFFFYALKNRAINICKNRALLLQVAITNILYEFFFSSRYDNYDMIAIIISCMFIYFTEKVKFIIFKRVN